MSAFETLVRASGLPCRVEGRERLAVLVPDGNAGAMQLTADERQRILQVARSEGFTHVALELHADVAPLPGD